MRPNSSKEFFKTEKEFEYCIRCYLYVCQNCNRTKSVYSRIFKNFQLQNFFSGIRSWQLQNALRINRTGARETREFINILFLFNG